uniref:Uncharacterized protein n=3 Tax=Cacopsylla melanoneura TaxID=428564 RepID=A0A8D8TMP8_9HEMI
MASPYRNPKPNVSCISILCIVYLTVLTTRPSGASSRSSSKSRRTRSSTCASCSSRTSWPRILRLPSDKRSISPTSCHRTMPFGPPRGVAAARPTSAHSVPVILTSTSRSPSTTPMNYRTCRTTVRAARSLRCRPVWRRMRRRSITSSVPWSPDTLSPHPRCIRSTPPCTTCSTRACLHCLAVSYTCNRLHWSRIYRTMTLTLRTRSGSDHKRRVLTCPTTSLKKWLIG